MIWRDEEVLDFRGLAADVWTARWRILVASLTLAMGGVLIVVLATPSYRAVAVLAPTAEQRASASSAVGSATTAGATVGGLARTRVESRAILNETMAVIRSRDLVERFIRDANIAPVLLQDRGWLDLRTWRLEVGVASTLADAVDLFVRDVRNVYEDGETGLVFVTVVWHDPEVAAEWANALVARANAELRERALRQSNDTLRRLEFELADAPTAAYRTAIGRQMGAQLGLRMLASVDDEYAFRVVGRALAPDEGDVYWPSAAQIVGGGGAIGLFGGLLVVVIRRLFGEECAWPTDANALPDSMPGGERDRFVKE